jgi:hypothetical protein
MMALMIKAKVGVANAIVNGERSEKGFSPVPFTIAAGSYNMCI